MGGAGKLKIALDETRMLTLGAGNARASAAKKRLMGACSSFDSRSRTPLLVACPKLRAIWPRVASV